MVLNADSARFECTFGRGCDGVCCRDGRPPVSDHDRRQIDAALPDVLRLMRKEARRVLETDGYVDRRGDEAHDRLRVVRGWCIFFNQGCALHRIGEARGSRLAHKPLACAVFPLARKGDGQWLVRQAGQPGEASDVSCLVPHPATPFARETLAEEIELAALIG